MGTFFSMEDSDSEFTKVAVPTLKAFLKAHSQSVSGNKQELVAHAIGCHKTHFSMHSQSCGQPKNDAKTLFPSSITFHL